MQSISDHWEEYVKRWGVFFPYSELCNLIRNRNTSDIGIGLIFIEYCNDHPYASAMLIDDIGAQNVSNFKTSVLERSSINSLKIINQWKRKLSE